MRQREKEREREREMKRVEKRDKQTGKQVGRGIQRLLTVDYRITLRIDALMIILCGAIFSGPLWSRQAGYSLRCTLQW